MTTKQSTIVEVNWFNRTPGTASIDAWGNFDRAEKIVVAKALDDDGEVVSEEEISREALADYPNPLSSEVAEILDDAVDHEPGHAENRCLRLLLS